MCSYLVVVVLLGGLHSAALGFALGHSLAALRAILAWRKVGGGLGQEISGG